MDFPIKHVGSFLCPMLTYQRVDPEHPQISNHWVRVEQLPLYVLRIGSANVPMFKMCYFGYSTVCWWNHNLQFLVWLIVVWASLSWRILIVWYKSCFYARKNRRRLNQLTQFLTAATAATWWIPKTSCEWNGKTVNIITGLVEGKIYRKPSFPHEIQGFPLNCSLQPIQWH